MPISAIRAAGSAVRHRTTMRMVRLNGSRNNTGRPIAAVKMPASITLRALNIPPKKVLVSIKLGGIM